MTAGRSVWIVVLNWNGVSDTLACLESLRALHYVERRIIVVDNGSTDGSVAALRSTGSRLPIEVIEAGKNLGYAGGNNLGIRYALDRGADFVLILNNDTTVDPMLLDELVSAAERHPAASCFGPWIFYMQDPDRLWFSRSDWEPGASAFTAPGKGRPASEFRNQTTDTEYVCGAALFFRADVVRQIGLLDERFFLVYEDSDWCFRARRAGLGCSMVPTARVWHKIGTSFGSEASPLRGYFSARNKLLWAEKNVSRREWWRMLCTALRRFYPRLAVDRGATGSLARAWWWAGTGFAREWARSLRDPLQIAHRRGVMDYLLRRFGDCPPRIRVLTKLWAGTQSSAAEPDSARPEGGRDLTSPSRSGRESASP